MIESPVFSVDDFPCGCLVTSALRRIVFANAYFLDRLGWAPAELVGCCIETLLSQASHIFCESYVYPMLLKDGTCLETQLTCLTPAGERIAVVANARNRPTGM